MNVDLDAIRSELPAFITDPNPDIYRSDNYVVVDFETTNLDKGSALNDNNKLVLACWYSPRSGHRFHWGGEFDQDELLRDIQGADFIVAHNAKFELQWLKRCGLEIADTIVWDTMLADYVEGGNRWQMQHLSLNSCLQRHKMPTKLDTVSRMIKAGICPSVIPRNWLLAYCTQDVSAATGLFQSQLTTCTQIPIVYTRCLVTPVLADIEFNGMQLDQPAVMGMWEEKETELASLSLALESFTGGINMNSPKQVTEYLYDDLGFSEVRDRSGNPIHTPKGGRSASSDTIDCLRPKSDVQVQFLELFKRGKEVGNELSKYLRKFKDCCEEAGGFLQGQFNQMNTKTHRLSSSGLKYKTQFQNFPRAYKPIFKARQEGWVIGEADGAQLEFRAAAHLGRDDTARDDIIGGTDIHAVTSEIIGCSRQAAKAHTFKPLYGGKSGTAEERKYYEFFGKKYAGITATQGGWIDSVLTNKYLTTEWGMKYYWPSTRMERSGYVVNSTAICNYPVQAFATAEIIPITLVYMWHYLKRMDAEMLIVNTVHDSVICEMPEEEVPIFHALAERCFLQEVYTYLRNIYYVEMTVPLATGVKVAPRWGVTDEETLYQMEI